MESTHSDSEFLQESRERAKRVLDDSARAARVVLDDAYREAVALLVEEQQHAADLLLGALGDAVNARAVAVQAADRLNEGLREKVVVEHDRATAEMLSRQEAAARMLLDAQREAAARLTLGVERASADILMTGHKDAAAILLKARLRVEQQRRED